MHTDKHRVLHNLRPRAKNGVFILKLAAMAAYSIVNEHLRIPSNAGGKNKPFGKGLYLQVSSAPWERVASRPPCKKCRRRQLGN